MMKAAMMEMTSGVQGRDNKIEIYELNMWHHYNCVFYE